MAAETDKNWKKAQISDYDTSLSLVEYQEVDETEAEKMQITTATGELATSGTVGSSAPDAAVSLATDLQPGEFGFTTYGYGHGCGLSQNGANFYATYGGYDYQAILFHYYPGTTLMQVDIPDSVTAGGRTGSVLDIISMLVYNEMGSTMAPEAMKAQAVAAFTYVMNPKANNNSLICKDNPPQNVIDAVQSVLGQALYYNGDYALTVYSASSGGYTAAASDVFRVNMMQNMTRIMARLSTSRKQRFAAACNLHITLRCRTILQTGFHWKSAVAVISAMSPLMDKKRLLVNLCVLYWD